MKQKILIYLCMNAIFSKTMQDTETKMSQKLVFLVWMTFLLIIMTYPSSLVSQFFVKSQPYKVNP